MDTLFLTQSIENSSGRLQSVLTALIAVAKFLFLTPWGWVILLLVFTSMLFVKIQDKKGEVSFYSFVGGMSESLFWLFSNMTNIVFGLLLVLLVGLVADGFFSVKESLLLFNEVKTLESALRNLNSERKLVEVRANPLEVAGTPTMNVVIRYFAYSPVEDEDVETAEKSYSIEGTKLYIDFAVMNFDYSLIESGESYNIAFPGTLYSDTVAYNDGIDIFTRQDDDLPFTFELETDQTFLLSDEEYEETMNWIIESATNESSARLLGIRTSYGQSMSLTPESGTAYVISSTGAGGLVMETMD